MVATSSTGWTADLERAGESGAGTMQPVGDQSLRDRVSPMTDPPPELSTPIEPPPMRGLARHGLLNAAATILPGLYGVIAIGAILHLLGPASYAPWATAVVLLGWVNLLDFGLAQTVVRASARGRLGDPLGVRDVQEAAAVYVILGLVGGVAGIGVAFSIPVLLNMPAPQADAAIQVGVILALDTAIVLATAPWSGILRGTGRFDLLLAASTVQVACSLPLLLVLLPSLGLAGAATAQVVGRLFGRATMMWLLLRAERWFDAGLRRPTRVGLMRVARFSAPIFLIQVASQIGTGTDILIVGATSGSTAAGLYAAGAQLVRYLAYFLFPVVDVIYPRLSSIEYAKPHMAAPVLIRGVFLAALMATVAFGGLALENLGVLTLWSGQSAALSVGVLVLYAMTYAIITPAHVLVVAMIARGRHRSVSIVIVVEAVVNLLLSIVLAIRLGPIGPALSTLIVVSIDDLIVIPWIASRELRLSLFRMTLAGLEGAAAAIAVLLASRIITGEGPINLLARGGIALALASVLLALGLRRAIQPSLPTGSDRAREAAVGSANGEPRPDA